jgi:hypothetical protein
MRARCHSDHFGFGRQHRTRTLVVIAALTGGATVPHFVPRRMGASPKRVPKPCGAGSRDPSAPRIDFCQSDLKALRHTRRGVALEPSKLRPNEGLPLAISGLRTVARSPETPECSSSAGRGRRRDPSRPFHRRDESRDHRRDSGIRPGCHPTPGPRSRLGTIAGTDRVGPRLRWPLPNRLALNLLK